MNLIDLIQTEVGKVLVSVILGLGLATLFRKSCKNKNCLVFVPPDMDTLKDDVYSYNGKCYKYQQRSVNCDPTKVRVSHK